MVPLKANKIRMSMEKCDTLKLQAETYNSIQRMAFEKHSSKQIFVD